MAINPTSFSSSYKLTSTIYKKEIILKGIESFQKSNECHIELEDVEDGWVLCSETKDKEALCELLNQILKHSIESSLKKH